MGPRRDVRFVSSGVKLPCAAPAPAPAPALLSAALPFAHIGRAIDAATRRVAASLPRIPAARAERRRHGKDGGGGGVEERVLISEVVVRGKDGEPLERAELEAAAVAALRACRPNAALTVREVREDVHRVVESGFFRSCMPVAVDTRDGIRLVFEVEPNQDFHGLVCEGANMLPSKFLEDAFRGRHVAAAARPDVPLGSTVPFTTMQGAVSKNMVESLAVPTFRVGYTITTDALDELYKKIKAKGVTMTALLAKATAMALVQHPVVNSSCRDGKSFTYNSSINIAVAVAIDGGLITPVLQDADKVDIYSLSRKWKELVDKARAKQLQPHEYNFGIPVD